MAKLYMMGAHVSKRTPTGAVSTIVIGYAHATCEDEARGAFVPVVYGRKPGFSIDEILVQEILPVDNGE